MITEIFTPYTPKNCIPYVQYLKDDKGNDWYKIQKEFSEGTIKFTFNKAGIITSLSKDISSLFPIYLSVAELESKNIPESLDISGKWFFDGKKIIPRIYTLEERIHQIENQKTEKMVATNMTIQPLQDSIDLDIATDKEIEQLIAWKKYRVLLSKVDTSQPDRIQWPETPKK
ncbi:tail fiber assembly protein [Photorhabdus temperata]|uniref:Caudovirales tail fiber assembly protein n=1 Tax=Photorhabdus temperata subsp. temperata Meg1 TaxID=1393735 RepID=A0A081RRP7_PHOTE|nr:tail fiber assembly protein [Photorhabdus temperata]KER01350.1 Caudovirales tail fiber assembly protein [Photorhabdus temperata subsp. temperata Meg1]